MISEESVPLLPSFLTFEYFFFLRRLASYQWHFECLLPSHGLGMAEAQSNCFLGFGRSERCT